MERVQANGEVFGQQQAEAALLSDQEKDMLQDTWAVVFQNSEAAGVAVLTRLFVKFPSSKKYFKDFQHMEDPEEMAQSTQFRKHAVRVINGINTLVENIHDATKVASVLKLVAKAHALRHKVDPVYFKIIGGVILEVLLEAFPDTFHPAEVQGAWSKLMGVLYTHVTRVYAELGWV
ncbi:cytoglobin-2-like [Clupea harengus]|uniref:superoxide dismutase n=1 Tax=Clupea harengus TaxID=7950 RepID=A0A8M1KC41_CLUHA|nr:cytoglobin-2-like [Clupea harengus]